MLISLEITSISSVIGIAWISDRPITKIIYCQYLTTTYCPPPNAWQAA